MESQDNQRDETSGGRHASAQVGAEAADPYADSSDAMRRGMEAFLEKAGATEGVDVGQKKGNLFEYIEAAKFNADAARHRSALRASITDANGNPHAPQDLRLTRGPDVVADVQAKSNEAASDLAYEVAREKYEGMSRLVPEDKETHARASMEQCIQKGTLKVEDYREARDHLDGELRQGDVTSGGTSHEELIEASRNPDSYALKQEIKAAAKEAGVNAAATGGVSFVCTALWSGFLNGAEVYRRKKTLGEAAADTTKEASKSGGQGAAVGVASTAIRNGAAHQGLGYLAQSNVATSVAAATIEVGVTTYALVQGEITPEEAVQEMGESAISTMAGLYVGAAAGVAFGPAGMLMGSMAGYLVSSEVYQSCISILKEADLAERKAKRAVKLSEEACEVIRAQRLEMERLIEEVTEARRQTFEAHFRSVDAALQAGDPGEVVSALSDVATTLDENLQYEEFEAFDEFMIRSNKPLQL